MVKRLIIGMSGASGAPLTVELLQRLKEDYPEVERHLIVTRGAEMTLLQETRISLKKLEGLADICYSNYNIGAAPASGSFRAMGMIVVPCSMKTVAGIASGYSDNLLLRAADVTLKEHRKLVLVARESPLSTIHLRNLTELSRIGAIILPPMLSYYNHPKSIEDCTKHIVNRMLAQFGLEKKYQEWEGMDESV